MPTSARYINLHLTDFLGGGKSPDLPYILAQKRTGVMKPVLTI